MYVADSLIKGAGQGLFAKIDVEANTVMSFYNGVRITHTEVKSKVLTIAVCVCVFTSTLHPPAKSGDEVFSQQGVLN